MNYGPRNNVIPARTDISVRLIPDQYKRIAHLAADEGRSMSSYVRELVRTHLGLTG